MTLTTMATGLAKLGEQEWELVATTPAITHYTESGAAAFGFSGAWHPTFWLLFKRLQP